ncbi:MAG: DUF503 domain-containing protein [Dehalococcoidia bacterium]|nr:DUF503 domain-containing protein [Dehalococcoidia bacterium]
MVTIGVLLRLRLEGVHSLKEKRAIVRSLVERLHQRALSAAEVGLQDRLQAAEVGFAVVSGDAAIAHRLVEETRRFVEGELLGRAEVIASELEELTIGD